MLKSKWWDWFLLCCADGGTSSAKKRTFCELHALLLSYFFFNIAFFVWRIKLNGVRSGSFWERIWKILCCLWSTSICIFGISIWISTKSDTEKSWLKDWNFEFAKKTPKTLCQESACTLLESPKLYFSHQIVLVNTSSRRQLVSVFAGVNENLEKCFSGPFGHSKTPKKRLLEECALLNLGFCEVTVWRDRAGQHFQVQKKFLLPASTIAKDSELFFWGKERKLALLSRNTCWTFNLFHAKWHRKSGVSQVQTLEMKLFNVTDVLLATLSHCNRLQELVIAWGRVLSTFSSERRVRRRSKSAKQDARTLRAVRCLSFKFCNWIHVVHLRILPPLFPGLTQTRC